MTLLAPAVRRGAVVVRWSGNLAADTFDVALRGRGGGWRLVAAHVAQQSYRAGPAARKRAFARVRARHVDGRVSAWTTPVPLPTPR